MRTGALAAVGIVASLSLGCATNFSPEMMRTQIRAQRGEDPRTAFELDLGRFTTSLIKSALAPDDGELPFAGLTSLQLAVYTVPAPSGPALDVTAIPVRGWDEVLRAHDERRSGMVLIKPKQQTIGDLVIVGAGPEKVIYARLKGRLDPELPSDLGAVLQEGGPDEVQRVLSELGE
jgi:hypothetical protein